MDARGEELSIAMAVGNPGILGGFNFPLRLFVVSATSGSLIGCGLGLLDDKQFFTKTSMFFLGGGLPTVLSSMIFDILNGAKVSVLRYLPLAMLGGVGEEHWEDNSSALSFGVMIATIRSPNPKL